MYIPDNKNYIIIFDVLYRDFWGCLLQFSLTLWLFTLFISKNILFYSKITNMHVYTVCTVKFTIAVQNFAGEIQ